MDNIAAVVASGKPCTKRISLGGADGSVRIFAGTPAAASRSALAAWLSFSSVCYSAFRLARISGSLALGSNEPSCFAVASYLVFAYVMRMGLS